MSDDSSPQEYDPRTQPRVPRSRLDRPCDTCRKQKHLCVIPIRDEPCVACKARSRPCTFNMPPTTRKRKPKDANWDNSDEVGSQKRKDRNSDIKERRQSSTSQGKSKPPVQTVSNIASSSSSTSPGIMSSWARMNGMEPTTLASASHAVQSGMSSEGRDMSKSMINYLPPVGTIMGNMTGSLQSTSLSAVQMSYGNSGGDARIQAQHRSSINSNSEGMSWSPDQGRGMQNMPLISEERSSLSQTGVRPDAYTTPMTLLKGLDDSVTANGDSLDLEPGEEAESHFLGSGVFSGFTLSEVARATQSPSNHFGVNIATPTASSSKMTGMGTLNFRQVSKDPNLPAFFVQFPALMYGGAKDNGKSIWDAAVKDCQTVSRDILPRALAKLQHIVLPAIPCINLPRLEAVCLGMSDYGPIPYMLLTTIVAFTTTFVPEIFHLRQALWRHALAGMEQEMKRPRLRTIQMTLLLLIGMPGENAGQSDIALARAIGAAHLLGLHIDPSNWSLPHWERSLRKRIFWLILFHDKFRALLFGRPSNLHSDNYHIPLPTLADGDWQHARDEHGEMQPVIKESERWSFESWIALCRLVEIVDKLLTGFYTIKVAIKPLTGIGRIGLLEEIMAELSELESTLQGPLRYRGMIREETLPTGIRSMQLTFLGLRVICHRLQLESLPHDASDSTVSAFLPPTLVACEAIVEMIDGLSAADRAMFWLPYTSHHISNTITLLLRIALRSRSLDQQLFTRARASANQLIDALLRIHEEDPTWDIATTAMKRSATILLNAGRELDDMKEAYRRFASVLELPMPTELFSLEEILGINNLDQSPWTSWANQTSDFSWLDASLMSGWSADDVSGGMNGQSSIQLPVQMPATVDAERQPQQPQQQLSGNANGNTMLTDNLGGMESFGTPGSFWRPEG